MMEAHTFLLHLVFILIAARIVGEFAAFYSIPPVIGELVAGVIIGPNVLGLMEISQPIHLLAQIGIILLLFEVGIETDISKLTSAGNQALLVALGGVIFPFFLGVAVSLLFGFSNIAALFVGSTFTATSIGITLRVMRDLNKQHTPETQIIIGAAVLDDIIGVVLLTILYEFSLGNEINLWNGFKVLIFITLFFLIAPVAAKVISQTIKKWDEKSSIPGLLPTTIVSLILFFSWMASQMGAPELLGGFAAGLALSRQFFLPFGTFLHQSHAFSHRVEEQMKPIVHLFTPIFFVAIGLSLDFKSVPWGSPFIWLLTAALFVTALIGKLLSGFVLTKESFLRRLIIGSAMVPRGEVGLIFASVGVAAKALDNELYTALTLVIALTTLITPFVLRLLYDRDPRSFAHAHAQKHAVLKHPHGKK